MVFALNQDRDPSPRAGLPWSTGFGGLTGAGRSKRGGSPCKPIPITITRLPRREPRDRSRFPRDHWSPETLLVASVADCFILSFRAIARASKFAWTRLECEAEGVLDRVDKITRFTEIMIRAHLVIPEGVDPRRGRRLLEKAEASCLITNSLLTETRLSSRVDHEAFIE